jgi:hypothetical protein
MNLQNIPSEFSKQGLHGARAPYVHDTNIVHPDSTDNYVYTLTQPLDLNAF